MATKAKQPTARQPSGILHLPGRVWWTSKTWASLRESSHLLATLAAVWLVFAVLELALNSLIPGSALRNDQIPLGARFSLASYAIMVLAAFGVAIGVCLMLVARVGHRLLPMGSAIAWVTRGLVALLVWLILLLYGASWATFWQTGNFLDREAFAFIAPHPLQVFHWVDTDIAVAVVGLTLVAAVIISEWIPPWVAAWRPATQRRLLLTCGAVVGWSVVGAFFGELYSGWGERQYMRSGILYRMSRDNASGPFAYVVTDIRKHARTQRGELGGRDGIQIIRRPITSMPEYLAGADGDGLNRWNVIILLVESLSTNQLQVYGGKRDVMPVVDALAREARVFLNAYTQASHTNYASLVPLSSHYPLRSATTHVYPENPTYPRVLIYDVLKALGYRTAIFSSSNEYWGGMIHYLQTSNIDRFFHAATFKGPTYFMPGDTGFASWVKTTKHAGSVDDRFTVSEAIQWIDGLHNEPFFIHVNLQNSHPPYRVPKDFPRRFSPAKLDFTIRFAYFPKDKIEVVKNVYADSLAYMDSQIARLFQHLKQRGLWERTVIVVTSDHGQAFYEHGFAAHASQIFNEVMKVPLIIRAPGLKPALDERPAQHIDIAPSVLNLLGLPPHPSFQGISLFDTRPDPNRSIYMIAQTPRAYQYGIIRSRFKLIYDEWERRYMLYDLVSDPAENIDIAASKSALVDELFKRLQTWRRLQIDYYTDDTLHTREYPPILAD